MLNLTNDVDYCAVHFIFTDHVRRLCSSFSDKRNSSTVIFIW